MEKYINEKKLSNYVGTIGKNIEIEIEVIEANKYVPTNVKTNFRSYIVKDKDGNLLRWISETEDYLLKVGETYKIKGLVKDKYVFDYRFKISGEKRKTVGVKYTEIDNVSILD